MPAAHEPRHPASRHAGGGLGERVFHGRGGPPAGLRSQAAGLARVSSNPHAVYHPIVQGLASACVFQAAEMRHLLSCCMRAG